MSGGGWERRRAWWQRGLLSALGKRWGAGRGVGECLTRRPVLTLARCRVVLGEVGSTWKTPSRLNTSRAPGDPLPAFSLTYVGTAPGGTAPGVCGTGTEGINVRCAAFLGMASVASADGALSEGALDRRMSARLGLGLWGPLWRANIRKFPAMKTPPFPPGRGPLKRSERGRLVGRVGDQGRPRSVLFGFAINSYPGVKKRR